MEAFRCVAGGLDKSDCLAFHSRVGHESLCPRADDCAARTYSRKSRFTLGDRSRYAIAGDAVYLRALCGESFALCR